MLIDRAFILAAGKGSRMGAIGATLPKVLWPVFETTLLGMQIKFLKGIGVSDIWVNGHHQSQKVQAYLEKHYQYVHYLYEKELLDAGGGVHNFIIHSGSKTPFLVINSDQYLELDGKTLNELMTNDLSKPSTLCAMDIPGGYSSLICREGFLTSISNKSNGPMFTGLSRINPNNINPVAQASKFFSTVCDYKNQQINVILSNGVFWDFGSPALYRESLTKLFEKLLAESKLLERWVDSGMINKTFINKELKSYYCNQPGVLNFSGKELKHEWPANSVIIQEPDLRPQLIGASLVYGEILEELN